MAKTLPFGWAWDANNSRITIPTNDVNQDTTYHIQVKATYNGEETGDTENFDVELKAQVAPQPQDNCVSKEQLPATFNFSFTASYNGDSITVGGMLDDKEDGDDGEVIYTYNISGDGCVKNGDLSYCGSFLIIFSPHGEVWFQPISMFVFGNYDAESGGGNPGDCWNAIYAGGYGQVIAEAESNDPDADECFVNPAIVPHTLNLGTLSFPSNYGGDCGCREYEDESEEEHAERTQRWCEEGINERVNNNNY